jgi:hypothetical protein
VHELAIEQRQARERVDRVDVLGHEAEAVEHAAVVRRVPIRVAQQAPQEALLHVAQLRQREALGLLRVAQERHRRPTAERLECGEQRVRQDRPVQVHHVGFPR